MRNFFRALFERMRTLIGGVFGTFLPVYFLLPIIMIIVGIPIQLLLYWSGFPDAAQFLGWTIAYVTITLFFLFWVTAVIAAKLVRQGVNLLEAFPRLATSFFGRELPISGISEEDVMKFKGMIAGSMAWAMFLVFIIAVLPYRLVPIGLIVTYAAFLFLATRQEGWIQKPPRFMQWLAGFIALSLVTSVFMQMFLPNTAKRVSQEVDSVDTFIDKQLEKGGQWLSGKSEANASTGKDLPVPHNNVSSAPSSSVSAKSVHVSHAGATIRQKIGEIERRHRLGKDTNLEELIVRRACLSLTKNDLKDDVVARAQLRYCH